MGLFWRSQKDEGEIEKQEWEDMLKKREDKKYILDSCKLLGINTPANGINTNALIKFMADRIVALENDVAELKEQSNVVTKHNIAGKIQSVFEEIVKDCKE